MLTDKKLINSLHERVIAVGDYIARLNETYDSIKDGGLTYTNLERTLFALEHSSINQEHKDLYEDLFDKIEGRVFYLPFVNKEIEDIDGVLTFHLLPGENIYSFLYDAHTIIPHLFLNIKKCYIHMIPEKGSSMYYLYDCATPEECTPLAGKVRSRYMPLDFESIYDKVKFVYWTNEAFRSMVLVKKAEPLGSDKYYHEFCLEQLKKYSEITSTELGVGEQMELIDNNPVHLSSPIVIDSDKFQSLYNQYGGIGNAIH